MTVTRHDLVLAFYPNARGFAYAIFEGPETPVDWGIREILHSEGRVSACVRRLSVLIDGYRPDCLVLRNPTGATSAMMKLIEGTEGLASNKGVPTYRVSRKEIRSAFAHLESPTRYAIAAAIAEHIAAFTPLLPPARKIWNGEDRRMALFDAAALALTLLGREASERTRIGHRRQSSNGPRSTMDDDDRVP